MNATCRAASVIVLSAAGLLTAFADPSAPKLSEEEKAILDWTNQVREREKRPMLKVHPLLAATARAHSLNMAKKKVLAHELDGKNVEKRALEAGYDYASIGENLAGGDGPVPEFFKMWLASAVHREHIFQEKYREIGISVVRDDKGQLYCTVVFGVERGKNRP
jgi:uncharacterized protein YkwD